jgi:hypothetical protein
VYSGISLVNRTKTAVMKEIRHKEEKMKFDTSAYDNSFHILKQFNEMKKIAANLSFVFKGEFVVCQEIIVDIIDELRTDRKIKMAIYDSETVKEYIM